MKLLFLQLDSEQYFFSFFYNDPLDFSSLHFQNLYVKQVEKNCQGFQILLGKKNCYPGVLELPFYVKILHRKLSFLMRKDQLVSHNEQIS